MIRTAQLTVRLDVEPVPATADAAADRDADAAARAAAVTTAAGTVRSVAGAAGGFVAGADGGGSALTITLRCRPTGTTPSWTGSPRSAR